LGNKIDENEDRWMSTENYLLIKIDEIYFLSFRFICRKVSNLTIARFRSVSVVESDTVANIIATLAFESPPIIRAIIKTVKLNETHHIAYESDMPI
jgi:hypothetical protein